LSTRTSTSRPAQRVAVVETDGDPNEAGAAALSALYGSIYALKFAHKKQGGDFKVGTLIQYPVRRAAAPA
jgi:hypothetical protein